MKLYHIKNIQIMRNHRENHLLTCVVCFLWEENNLQMMSCFLQGIKMLIKSLPTFTILYISQFWDFEPMSLLIPLLFFLCWGFNFSHTRALFSLASLLTPLFSYLTSNSLPLFSVYKWVERSHHPAASPPPSRTNGLHTPPNASMTHGDSTWKILRQTLYDEIS